MPSKAAKRDARAEKLFDDIVYNGHKVAQSNRKGGGLPDGQSEDAMAADYLRLLKLILPGALVKLSGLKDPRKERMCGHTMATLIIYGLIMFLAHMPSRRAANRDVGSNSAYAMIRQVIPELETMPHADTLARLLKRIDADGIEACYEKHILEFIRSKTFLELNPGQCLIAIDGTQKFSRRYCFDEHMLITNRGDEEKERYYVYALESVLILGNGMVLPLFTEFLENDDGEFNIDGAKKQDCELKAFIRLTDKIAKLIGKGRVILAVDGLYASGPVISRCKAFGWEYMITLKRGSLPKVWEDYDGLRKCEPENELHNTTEENRRQTFNWSNKIEYTYGKNHKKLYLNVVECKEEWVEMHPRSGNKPESKICTFAWLSSSVVSKGNVLHLCNNTARKRWRIENHFLTEKHQGYNYSHCYSYNWNAMKAFHSLMKFAHFINVLISSSIITCAYVKLQGARWFVKKVWIILMLRGLGQQVPDILSVKPRGKGCRCNYRDIRLRREAMPASA